MATIELRLNPSKTGNYAFFCPVTRLHLTLANPVGITDRVSHYILRGIKSKTLIDVNGVINLETGKVNANVAVEATKTEIPVKPEPTVIQEQKEELSQEVEAVVETVEVEEVKRPKRGKRVQTNSVDETVE